MSKSVLLIDDSPLQLRMRETVLREAGFLVAVATSAASALALLRSEGAKIGAIVTDHIMPEATGAEFVRQLRELNATVPVVVVSGLPDAEEEYAGLDITFRQKPCPPPELISLVHRAFDRAA